MRSLAVVSFCVAVLFGGLSGAAAGEMAARHHHHFVSHKHEQHKHPIHRHKIHHHKISELPPSTPQTQSARKATTDVASPLTALTFGVDGGTQLIRVAERYLGGNPTGWAHDWCARFLNAVVLPEAGERGTGDNRAISFARWGEPSGPQPGAIAVMPHHVGIVMADEGSRVRIISGNHGHRVAIGDYPKAMIVAYRWP